MSLIARFNEPQTALAESSGTLSSRGWGLWRTPLPSWCEISNNGEALQVRGGIRLEVLSGSPLTYQDEGETGMRKNIGTLAPGVHYLRGTVMLYMQAGATQGRMLITRMS